MSAQESKTQWSGVYTSEQAARGEKSYQANCSPCHAADATGGTFGGDVGRGPALIGKDFAADWNNRSLGDLFDWINDNMPLDRPER